MRSTDDYLVRVHPSPFPTNTNTVIIQATRAEEPYLRPLAVQMNAADRIAAKASLTISLSRQCTIRT